MAAALVFSTITACATDDDDQVISADKLPAAAKSFIADHFPGDKISFATVDRDIDEVSYYALLASGTKIEFDSTGAWEEVSCRNASVPASIVPDQIEAYVTANYAGMRIIEIESNLHGYDIKLSNGVEIDFDKNGNMLRTEL